MNFKDGVHDISNEQYHSSDGISRSMLMQLKKSPYHYWYKYLSGIPEPEKPTPALIEGELIHTAVLEPEKLSERFFVLPEHINRRTKEGKAEYQSILDANKGKQVISDDQMMWSNIIRQCVYKDEMAAALLSEAKVEQSIFFTHPTGIQCKARPDAWAYGIVSDLKTTTDASERAMQISCIKYGYFLQAGMISYALKSIGETLEKFVIIAVEKKAPFAVCCYPMNEEAIEYGEGLVDGLLATLLECTARGKWPGYQMKELSVPNWALNEELELIDHE